MRQPVILYRELDSHSKEWQQELKAMNKHFVTCHSRMEPTGGDLVIGRYSVLPFYKELQEDLASKGASLINSYRQHRYAADLQNWVMDLEEFTPATWDSIESVPDNVGPLVVKGETNSRKNKWRTHMFANNKQEALEIFLRLLDDSWLSDQKISLGSMFLYTPIFMMELPGYQ